MNTEPDDRGNSAGILEEVDVATLAAALAEGAVLIDVREPDEWLEARIPGAVSISLGQVPDRVADFSTRPTYVVCRSGGRSMRACEFLAARGAHVVNVAGGTLAWLESGRPHDSGPT